MRRIALTVRADAVEEVLDALLPLLPRGVHPGEAGEGLVELAARGDDLPPGAELAALPGVVGVDEREDDAGERPRSRQVGGRLAIRPPGAPPGRHGLPELVIDSPAGAFGTGAHSTTRMCLELLLALEPGGPFADLGCGAGVLAIAAAKLGWSPVLAVDHEARSVAAAARNAERNAVTLETHRLDLLAVPAPPAATLAANVPPAVHERIAADLAPAVRHAIVSGIGDARLDAVLEGYARAGLRPLDRRSAAGWTAVLLGRGRG